MCPEVISPQVTSLLDVPSTPFPTVFLSRTASLTPPTASLTGIRLNPCVTALGDGPSGHLAGSIPNKGYEPKFCIDVSSEHTPINSPNRNMSSSRSTTRNLLQHSVASRSSQHTAASTVPTLGTSLTKVLADCDSVASRASIMETCADMNRETVVSSVLGSVSKGKRDRDQNVVQTLRDRQNLHKNLERKAELAVRREKLDQQRKNEAEADVELKHWEKRNSDIALYEIKQEFESQRLQLQQTNHWAGLTEIK